MERFLGPLVILTALVALAGCSDDPDERAEDRAEDPAGNPTTIEAADPTARVVDIVSEVAADGNVTETATIIESDAMLVRYLNQFRSPVLVDELTAVVESVVLAEGRVIGLAVIEISCDEPPSAEVVEDGGEFVVTAGKVVNPHPECFAPVTSVAVLDLPAR